MIKSGIVLQSMIHLKGLFDGGRDGLLVMEQTSKEDEQVRQQPGVRWIIMWDNLEHKPRHSVWKGRDKGAEAKHSPMPCRHQHPGRTLAALRGRAAGG